MELAVPVDSKCPECGKKFGKGEFVVYKLGDIQTKTTTGGIPSYETNAVHLKCVK